MCLLCVIVVVSNDAKHAKGHPACVIQRFDIHRSHERQGKAMFQTMSLARTHVEIEMDVVNEDHVCH